MRRSSAKTGGGSNKAGLGGWVGGWVGGGAKKPMGNEWEMGVSIIHHPFLYGVLMGVSKIPILFWVFSQMRVPPVIIHFERWDFP